MKGLVSRKTVVLQSVEGEVKQEILVSNELIRFKS